MTPKAAVTIATAVIARNSHGIELFGRNLLVLFCKLARICDLPIELSKAHGDSHLTAQPSTSTQESPREPDGARPAAKLCDVDAKRTHPAQSAQSWHRRRWLEPLCFLI